MEDFSKKGIELTADEVTEALVDAYRKKEASIEEQKKWERMEQNRRMLFNQKWTVNGIDAYMRVRANTIFEGKFSFDGQCRQIYELLCLYFSDDPTFITSANGLVVNEPDLNKGILLAGTFGVGKSWIMKLFQKQVKQCYYMRTAKQISEEYLKVGHLPEEYIDLFENSVIDNSVFMQPANGLCIDDLGAEHEKNSFGNRINVIGDIIEARYNKGHVGKFLHATTNLSADGLTEFYGGRVTSRMKEMFNIIHFKGNDLRK